VCASDEGREGERRRTGGARTLLASVEAITFDCYGTLVDWEEGILRSLAPVLDRHEVEVDDARLLALYGELEAEVEAEGWRPYREILVEVVRRLAGRLGFRPDPDEMAALAGGLPDWPLFPDTRGALERLGRRWRLGVVSNVDDALFAGTARMLDIDLDLVVTAEQVRRYKPHPEPLREALRRLDLPSDRVLHAAQSRYHDLGVARELGMVTAWVDRPSRRPGQGATPAAEAEPHLRVEGLGELAARLERAQREGRAEPGYGSESESEAAEGRGEVERIWIKPARRAPMRSVERAELVEDQGIVGNANQGGRRQVTVLAREAWEAAQDELDARVDPASRRANFLVRGVELEESRGRVLRIGSCRFRVEGETRPCRLMDEEHPGLRDALDPEWRGGVFAVIVEGGEVAVGDPVEWAE